MADLNKVILIGRLTREPDLNFTDGGTAICKFSIAVSKKFKSKSGGFKEQTVFPNIEVWGKSGENCAKFLSKGSQCMVEGELKQNNWEDKSTGSKRTSWLINAYNVQFLSSKTQKEREEPF